MSFVSRVNESPWRLFVRVYEWLKSNERLQRMAIRISLDARKTEPRPRGLDDSIINYRHITARYSCATINSVRSVKPRTGPMFRSLKAFPSMFRVLLLAWIPRDQTLIDCLRTTAGVKEEHVLPLRSATNPATL